MPFTSGAMLAAARDALANGWGAVAPCSGFHHAGYDFAGGFCTFNGLMVTALAVAVTACSQGSGTLSTGFNDSPRETASLAAEIQTGLATWHKPFQK